MRVDQASPEGTSAVGPWERGPACWPLVEDSGWRRHDRRRAPDSRGALAV